MSEPPQADRDPPPGLRLTLPAEPGLADAQWMSDELRAAGPAQMVCIDASEVAQMSTPVVLTLVSAINTRGEGDPKIQIRNPSGTFTDAFSDLGMFSDLMKMEFV